MLVTNEICPVCPFALHKLREDSQGLWPLTKGAGQMVKLGLGSQGRPPAHIGALSWSRASGLSPGAHPGLGRPPSRHPEREASRGAREMLPKARGREVTRGLLGGVRAALRVCGHYVGT